MNSDWLKQPLLGLLSLFDKYLAELPLLRHISSPVISTLVDVVRRYNPWNSARLQAANAQSSSTFVSLPAELLTEVLKSVTWKDILRLRVTCKALSEATKTRAIWAHLVSEHILSKPCPPRLERPIGMYTSTELEHLLLLWNSADIGWETDDGHAARERSFTVEPAEFVHLIKGGRWLLVTTDTGKVTYYDLDAENIVGVPLIPEQMQQTDSLNELFMSVDVDTDSPMLNFTIGFSVIDRSAGHDNDPAGCRATIQIWGVSLLLDGAHAIGLSATRLALFHHQPVIVALLALSLLGPAIAFNALHSDGCIYTFVVEWARANGNSITYPWRVFNPNTNSFLHLLPGNKIVLTNGISLWLLDYSTVDETRNTNAHQNSTATRLWRTNLKHVSDKSISVFLLTPNSVQFVMIALESIQSIVSEKNPSSNIPPPLVNLVDSPGFNFLYNEPFLGYTRAIAVDLEHDAWLVRYPLPGEGGSGPPTLLRKHLLSKSPVVVRCPVMDENSGRVVVPGLSGSQEMTVVDFALVFKQD